MAPADFFAFITDLTLEKYPAAQGQARHGRSPQRGRGR
jgi:hypothetical protein